MAAFKIFNTIRTLSINNKASCFKLANVYCIQNYSSKTEKDPTASISDNEKKKKTVPIPKITLVSPDSTIQIVSLDEAQKISKRRDLKLVKIIELDTKTQRPVYKLMTGAEFHAEDLKQRNDKKQKNSEVSVKGVKMLLINAGISEHDLESRIKHILKWISKRNEVRVVISGEASNLGSCEKVFHIIEENVKNEGRILQKRTKNNELKFQILPPKQKPEGSL